MGSFPGYCTLQNSWQGNFQYPISGSEKYQNEFPTPKQIGVDTLNINMGWFLKKSLVGDCLIVLRTSIYTQFLRSLSVLRNGYCRWLPASQTALRARVRLPLWVRYVNGAWFSRGDRRAHQDEVKVSYGVKMPNFGIFHHYINCFSASSSNQTTGPILLGPSY